MHIWERVTATVKEAKCIFGGEFSTGLGDWLPVAH